MLWGTGTQAFYQSEVVSYKQKIYEVLAQESSVARWRDSKKFFRKDEDEGGSLDVYVAMMS